jgi:hypothetical protein
MDTRVVLALVVGTALAMRADGRAETAPSGGRPDGGASLVTVPNGSTATPASSETEAPFPPPPRSLDSKRAPVPERLMLPADMEDIPLAPPTPTIPNSSGAQGSGANRTSAILKRPPKGSSGTTPSDIPRDNVTRTPEDQLAPQGYPSQGPR